MKVLRSEYTGDPTFLARFRAEAQHAASLSHPNVAAVFDYGEETAQDGTGETLAYLVMELVEGEPLSALLAREGALDTATTLSILRQTAFALGEAHRAGMVHRDVKPGQHPGAPRRQREDHRLRHRLVGAQRRADPHRPGHRHPPVPLAGAGRGPAGHPGERRLRPRAHRVRVPHRAPRLRRRQRRHHRAQAGAAGPRAAARRVADRRPDADRPRRGRRIRPPASPTARPSSPRSRTSSPAARSRPRRRRRPSTCRARPCPPRRRGRTPGPCALPVVSSGRPRPGAGARSVSSSCPSSGCWSGRGSPRA